MKKEDLDSIFKIIFAIGFVLVPLIINIVAKRNKEKSNSLSSSSPQQRKNVKASKPIRQKSFAGYHEKPEPKKKVEDVLAEIFGDKPSSLTPARAHLPSKVHKQEIHKSGRHAMKTEKEELPRFKTNIKDFIVDSPSLPEDISRFKPNILTETEVPVKTSPFLQKFKNINRDDLRYGIVLSEILGPPVALKSDSGNW